GRLNWLGGYGLYLPHQVGTAVAGRRPARFTVPYPDVITDVLPFQLLNPLALRDGRRLAIVGVARPRPLAHLDARSRHDLPPHVYRRRRGWRGWGGRFLVLALPLIALRRHGRQVGRRRVQPAQQVLRLRGGV